MALIEEPIVVPDGDWVVETNETRPVERRTKKQELALPPSESEYVPVYLPPKKPYYKRTGFWLGMFAATTFCTGAGVAFGTGATSRPDTPPVPKMRTVVITVDGQTVSEQLPVGSSVLVVGTGTGLLSCQILVNGKVVIQGAGNVDDNASCHTVVQ